MNHVLATVLHRGRKAASNLMSVCLASSRGGTSPEHKHGSASENGQSRGPCPRLAGGPLGSDSNSDAGILAVRLTPGHADSLPETRRGARGGRR